MSTPTLFSSSEPERTNNEWYDVLKDAREVNEMENAEQDTRLYEAQQTEQAVQGPDSLDESPEDQSLWGSPPPSPPPSPPSHSHGLALPIPIPPVVTGGIESQTTAPPAPLGPDMVVNNVPDESIAPELIGVPRPKQRQAAAKRVPKQQGPKRVPNGVGKPPKRLSPNQQQRQWDRERMAVSKRLRDNQAPAKAAEEPAAMMASGIAATQPGQLYGQNQFCKNCGQSLSQATSVFCPPAGPGIGYSQAAGPVYQQPPVPPAPFAAYAPAPAPAPHLAPPPPPPPAPILPPALVLPLAPHLAPPPPFYPQIPTTFGDPGITRVEQDSEAATWQPSPQQQDMYYQLPNWYNMF